MVKLASRGRGTGYSPLRGVMETVLGVAYTGEWPARLYGRFAKSRRVRTARHALSLLPEGTPSLRLAFVSDVHLGPTTVPEPSVTRGATIVLCYAPEILPLLVGDEERLVVCGHTHGGHVALPGRPLYVPGPVGTRYPAGMYRVGHTSLFVSRGVGATEMPLRTFAEPDVGVFDLVAQ